MVFTIAATIYCTLTYVAGFKLFNVSEPTAFSILTWIFSPISVPVGLLLVMTVG